MHAANLLNKRRQHREEQHRHPAVAKKPTNPSLLEPSSSNPSLCSTAATISTRPLPPVPTPTTITPPQQLPPERPHMQQQQPNGCTSVTPPLTGTGTSELLAKGVREQQILYHYSDLFTCANIGLCIMIAGVVIMTISGFICYLIGFGEPGVIIGIGGTCFVLIGLIVLSFGNSWYTSREKAKMRSPLSSYDAESGRARSVKRYPQEIKTNRSGLHGVIPGPTSDVEFSGIIPG